jgi:hypothetical protein
MIVYFHDLNLYTKINYGKHKGKTVKQIIETNYMWIEWALENITGFALDVYAWYYLLEIEGVIVNSKKQTVAL